MAKEALGHDPMKGVAVVFRAKRADRVKIVVWDGSGLVLYWKRLEGGGFKWPPVVDGVMRMNAHACTRLESHNRKHLRKDTNLRCIGARSMADSGR
ncbi:IS66 family insertion sequence element accessory protein TnpB [Bradyrhizobium sp. CB3481]|uniref:IS66 family insertion sequence element accessory protein TnpB n=1 Tax=Bradyrhizobium sp. CB3481 TaxID=3039158 RepID=UPI0024B19913|nr:IS66 family insertion sequence element accessory protein TnpB [Bradyrhizobium sp. CB3481]WFU14340.1 IS66 family insertion sequence element accessory protein TnpB [Bradyrhizobium sp. CB3481]